MMSRTLFQNGRGNPGSYPMAGAISGFSGNRRDGSVALLNPIHILRESYLL
jgi:hypothetical protein